jgi:cell division protein ZapA
LKHSVQVTILGQQYTVKSETPPEEVREVAAFVNEKISEVMAASKTVDTLNTALLALMNVAGAYLRLRDEGLGLEAQLEGRLRQLLERLEQACPDPPVQQEK